MNMKSIVRGAAAGMAAGLTFYALSEASPMKKNNIKRDAGKTVKAASNLLEDIKSMLMM